jgi:Formamidopyrimidine-DNA glycosylase
MPEGDTIHRAADTLQRAIGGQVVTRFESVLPKLTRADADAPIRGRTVERVEARGKHLLIWFSGDLVLRTHMRMNGSWHIYRPGERWQRPHRDMRIVIETPAMHAVAFTVPVAEFVTSRDLANHDIVAELGPDPLSDTFSAEQAIERMHAHGDIEIADVLLDQSAIAGIGNVFKSEVLFGARVNPFVPVSQLTREQLAEIVAVATRFMRANVVSGVGSGFSRTASMRRTTGRADPSARLWVYGRGGQPCRRCGTAISRQKQGRHARSTYWCPKCQPNPRTI